MSRSFRVFAFVPACVIALSLVAALPAAGVPVKSSTKVDPCSVITAADLAKLSTSYTITKTDLILKTNCLYTFQGAGADEGTSTSVSLFVEAPSEYSMQKAIVTKAKSVKGLNGGYIGNVHGNDQAGFKTKKYAVSLSGGGNTADLILLAKAINSHLK